MTNRFMMSVAAAALIAGTGFANAQGTKEAPSAGQTTQQSAPSPERGSTSAAPMNREGASKGSEPGMKSTQSDQKMQPGAKSEKSAQDNMKGEKGEKSKSMSSETEKGQGGKDMKAEGREGRDGNMKAEGREGRDGNQKAEGREGRETTGQAGAGAKMSSEQRTKISTVIRSEHVQPLRNVNFSISVGTRVPRDVSFHRLPTEIVTIYPEWRGYEYVLVNDQILVIDPRTFEIVAVLDA